jgi:hypothetical protein
VKTFCTWNADKLSDIAAYKESKQLRKYQLAQKKEAIFASKKQKGELALARKLLEEDEPYKAEYGIAAARPDEATIEEDEASTAPAVATASEPSTAATSMSGVIAASAAPAVATASEPSTAATSISGMVAASAAPAVATTASEPSRAATSMLSDSDFSLDD